MVREHRANCTIIGLLLESVAANWLFIVRWTDRESMVRG